MTAPIPSENLRLRNKAGSSIGAAVIFNSRCIRIERLAVENYLGRFGIFQNQKSKFENPLNLPAPEETAKFRPLPSIHSPARDIPRQPRLKSISASRPISETDQTIFDR